MKFSSSSSSWVYTLRITLCVSLILFSCLAHWVIQLLHSCLLVTRRRASSIVTPLFSRSFVMLSFQVTRGRLILRDPSGIQLSACFACLLSSICCIWLQGPTTEVFAPSFSSVLGRVQWVHELCHSLIRPAKRCYRIRRGHLWRAGCIYCNTVQKYNVQQTIHSFSVAIRRARLRSLIIQADWVDRVFDQSKEMQMTA